MRVSSEGRLRWALAGLLGCIALLAFAPSVLAADTGQITGTVTKSGGVEALAGIEVCAYGVGSGLEDGELEGLFAEHCAETGINGDYVISELPGGEYDVEFLAPFESTLNYVTQYYEDKPSLSEAQPVSVGTGVTPGIDAQMQEGAEIEGTVTERTASEDIIALQGIEVTAYETGKNEFPVGFATTGADGEYTVRGLATGSYKVEFRPGFESGLNYVAQYYDGALSAAAATPVPATQGAITHGINAELRVGGEITGTVTDASTHAPLPNVFVLAIGPNEVISTVVSTDASGRYTIVGLASGVYKVEFVDLATYITQYYDGQPSAASANPVTVSQGSTTPGINAALISKAPVDVAGPSLSGSPAVGQTLTCANGSWTGSPKPAFTHTWLRNGGAIAGATASTYAVQTADQGSALACRVTAKNEHGVASATSNTVKVPSALPPSPPPPQPTIGLLRSRLVVSGSSVRVSLLCGGKTCAGTIELTERVVVKHRHGRKTMKTLVLGRATYALLAGHSATIVVHLTSIGRRALATAKHHRLPAEISASVIGGVTRSMSVVLSEPAPEHGRRRHR